MDFSIDDVDVDGDELEFDVSASGYHEVEIEENEKVSFSLSDILNKIDNEKLLDHVGKDEILAYAKNNDYAMGDMEINGETLEKWLRESDANVVTAMRIVNRVLVG